ncbi:MAG: hypothetical protein AAFV43_15095 [Planctomycetota bacterium]
MSLRQSCSAVVCVILLAGSAGAQPAGVWNALGVTQAVKFLRNATVNPNGNHPGLERPKPPKPIADPANLESDNPAIKLAAEVKQQEDLKKQKIKALKYLSKMGCGCYPGVADAFAAATEDCTEDVRLAAAEAIQDAAGEVCGCCNESGCCSEDLLKTMAERAYGRDETGCYIEPSDRVRAALREALAKCCPGLPPVWEPAAPEEAEEEAEADTEVIPDSEDEETIPAGEEELSDEDPLQAGSPLNEQLKPFLQSAVTRDNRVDTEWVTGRITNIDPTGQRVVIQHEGDNKSLRGSRAEVFHKFLLGSEKVGDLRVVAAAPGQLVATGLTSMKYLEVGSTVRVQVAAPQPSLEPIPSMIVESAAPSTPGVRRPADVAVVPFEPSVESGELAEVAVEPDFNESPLPPTAMPSVIAEGYANISDRPAPVSAPVAAAPKHRVQVIRPAITPSSEKAGKLVGLFTQPQIEIKSTAACAIIEDRPQPRSVLAVTPAAPVAPAEPAVSVITVPTTDGQHHRADRLSRIITGTVLR